MTLSDTPSVFFSDLKSNEASSFGLNMGSAEREAETTTIDISNNFFLVSNMQGVGFSDVSGKPITIPDPTRRPTDLTYLPFVSLFPLPRSISALQHHFYPLMFLTSCFNHLSLLPLTLLYLLRHQQLLH